MSQVNQIPPIATPSKFEELTGTPASTCEKQLGDGRLPRYDNRLDQNKRGALYVNMVRLTELCVEQGKNFKSLNITQP